MCRVYLPLAPARDRIGPHYKKSAQRLYIGDTRIQIGYNQLHILIGKHQAAQFTDWLRKSTPELSANGINHFEWMSFSPVEVLYYSVSWLTGTAEEVNTQEVRVEVPSVKTLRVFTQPHKILAPTSLRHHHTPPTPPAQLLQ